MSADKGKPQRPASRFVSLLIGLVLLSCSALLVVVEGSLVSAAFGGLFGGVMFIGALLPNPPATEQ